MVGGRAISAAAIPAAAAATDDFFRSSMVFDNRLVFRIDAGDVSILFFLVLLSSSLCLRSGAVTLLSRLHCCMWLPLFSAILLLRK